MIPTRVCTDDHGAWSPERQLTHFRSEGFLRFERFVSAEAVAALTDVYDGMLNGSIDCSLTDRRLGGTVRQIMQPHLHHPIFRSNPALDAGRALARMLLGCDEPRIALQMLIAKEPGQLADTPWHQDLAYVAVPFAPAGIPIACDESVMFWVALDDVDGENGCMHFVPREHHTLLPHYVAAGAPDDPARLLAIVDAEKTLDSRTSVACPLPAGGATVHSFGTPHYTSGNRTIDRPRRACIFNFARAAREES